MRRAEGEVLPAVARRQGLAPTIWSARARRKPPPSYALGVPSGRPRTTLSLCRRSSGGSPRSRSWRRSWQRATAATARSRSWVSRESARQRSGTRLSGRRKDRGAVVLEARPAESEARLSFSGLTDLLSPVAPERVAVLPGPQRRALDVALLRVEVDRPPERRLVGTALLSLIRALAADREVVLAIDDVQWLDPPSAGATEFAIRRLTDEPVRAILSLRSGSADLLDHIVRGRACAGSSSGRFRSRRCTASLPRDQADVSAPDARADRAGVGRQPAARARDREAARPGRSRAVRAAGSRRASRRWSQTASGRCRREPATRCCARLRWRDPTSAWSTRRRSPLRRRRGSSASGPTGGSSSCTLSSLPRCTRRRRRGRRREIHRALAEVVARPRGDRAPSRPGLRRPGRRGRRHRPGCGSPGAQPGRTRHGGRADRPRSRASSRREARPSTSCGSSWPSTSTTRATSNAPPRCSRS